MIYQYIEAKVRDLDEILYYADQGWEYIGLIPYTHLEDEYNCIMRRPREEGNGAIVHPSEFRDVEVGEHL